MHYACSMIIFQIQDAYRHDDDLHGHAYSVIPFMHCTHVFPEVAFLLSKIPVMQCKRIVYFYPSAANCAHISSCLSALMTVALTDAGGVC